jgi:hypothetical protein
MSRLGGLVFLAVFVPLTPLPRGITWAKAKAPRLLISKGLRSSSYFFFAPFADAFFAAGFAFAAAFFAPAGAFTSFLTGPAGENLTAFLAGILSAARSSGTTLATRIHYLY